MVCPSKGSFELHRVLPQVKVLLVADGGHAGSEAGTFAAHKKAVAYLASASASAFAGSGISRRKTRRR